ncbi:MAG: hypothetical protein HY584_02260, partial [Candidatus Omnitrophica bacterium]|nr:hypothetical protein [Candidatus Omnitrophota bacterium]
MKLFFLVPLAFLISPHPGHAKLENFQAADVVLGQPDFTQATDDDGSESAITLEQPNSVANDGNKLFVVDRENNRVLIWNAIPNKNSAPADLVLGQPNFTEAVGNNGGIGARTLRTPRSASIVMNKVLVLEGANNRVLIWNSIPTRNFQPADVVIGQPDFVSSGPNAGGLSARSLDLGSLSAVFSDGMKLFIADIDNSRVLIWNSVPTTNFQPADLVLGQSNFTTSTANSGGLSARSLSRPTFLHSDGQRLFVSDGDNNRVLIWNSVPTANFQPADIVLGQPDFTSNTANNGGLSAKTLNGPRGVYSDEKRVFIADLNNNRILIWSSIPTTNFAAADIVLGQPDFVSATANNGGRSAKTLSGPGYALSTGKRLFVSDVNNHRVLIFNIASGSGIKLSPQFEQGKAVLGKVFHDVNGNGVQDQAKSIAQSAKRKKGKTKDAMRSAPSAMLEEQGIEGIKVMSDTGIYAITDEDGKYHFPYIETG